MLLYVSANVTSAKYRGYVLGELCSTMTAACACILGVTLLSLRGAHGLESMRMRRVGVENFTDGHALKIVGVQNDRPFHPSDTMSFLPDDRTPFIEPNTCTGTDCCPGNIYNPSVVNNGERTWNVYFGGWDGVKICKDSISVAVTTDYWASVNPHVPMVSTGSCQHVNNPSAVKVSNDSWAMVFTQANANINKPGVSLGTNGIDWRPNKGGSTFVIMQDYPGWGTPTSGADINGGNVIHYDNSTWHFLFTDVKQLNKHSVFHATGTDGMGGGFVYDGIAVSQPGLIVNDIKRVNGHYILGLHHNGPDTYMATSASPAAFSAPKLFFSHEGALDRYITSVGFVVDPSGTKLLGALYGAGAVPTLDHNRIFAQWIQKRVVFMSDDGEVLWSSTSAVGPNVQVLRPVTGQQDQSFTGRFHVYDVDHVDHESPGTFLYKSPILTVSPGEVWELTIQ